MEKKILYFPPQTEIVEIESESVFATSPLTEELPGYEEQPW